MATNVAAAHADTEDTIPILLLGDSGVGKTSFIARLTIGPNAPPTSALPTLSDLSQPFVFNISSRSRGAFRLEVSDTASPDNYTLLRPALIILCYSTCSRESLLSVKERWAPMVTTQFNHDEALPVLLLGLKRDLREGGDALGGVKEGHVLPQEAVRVASELRCDRYAECSAVTGELVPETWEDIVRTAVATRSSSGGKSQGAHCVIL